MVAFFTEQIVMVVLFMTSFVICLRSIKKVKKVKRGIELYQGEQIAMEFAWSSQKKNYAECYCLTGSYVCYYCPKNMFCNIRAKKCCPKPDSDNDCDNYCVPPKYTCCDGNGACENKYPTCCGHYCCKENEKCCGEKECCSAETKDCENMKNNRMFAIWKPTSLPVNVSPDQCPEDGCGKPIQNSEIKFFSEICKIFANATRLENPVNKLQFAVLTLNKLSATNSANKYRPFPIDFNIERQIGNYASASPRFIEQRTITKDKRILVRFDFEHAEIGVLKKINLLNGQPNPPTIYLFTFLSPCKRCVNEIISTKQKIKGSSMFIGWQLTYDKINQEDFFEGIRKMINAKITIVYLYFPNKLCDEEWEGPLLFQPTLLNDLVNKYDYSDVDFCESELALRSSFIKLINWLVWNCIKTFTLDGRLETKDRVIECMADEIEYIEPEINPCFDFSQTITVSIENLFYSNRKLLLSPPLDPQSKTTSISNRLNDLMGDYESQYLCFQVEYKKRTYYRK